MGMYTEFHFNCTFDDLPKEVVDILEYMIIGEDKPANIQTPEHEFFSTLRWRHMFFYDSYYFAAETHSVFFKDEIRREYVLSVRCNLKNYNREIEKFLAWIYPYIPEYQDSFLGFLRYEENVHPTLIYKTRNGIRLIDVWNFIGEKTEFLGVEL